MRHNVPRWDETCSRTKCSQRILVEAILISLQRAFDGPYALRKRYSPIGFWNRMPGVPRRRMVACSMSPKASTNFPTANSSDPIPPQT